MQLRELQEQFANEVLYGDSKTLRSLVRKRGLESSQRLQIYRNNIRFTLTEALQNVYLVTVKIVGEQFFRHLVSLYFKKYPPESGDLHEYGNQLPEFIEEKCELHKLGYLADIARIDWTLDLAYHAERSDIETLESLGKYESYQLGNLKLILNPSAYVLQSSYPIFDIWNFAQNESAYNEPPDANAGAQYVLITCHNEAPSITQIEKELFDFIKYISRSQTLGEIIPTLVEKYPHYDLQAGLQKLFALKTIAGTSLLTTKVEIV